MTVRLGRRDAIVGAVLAAACSSPAGVPKVVRLGFQPNLTNAPLLAGIASSRIAEALGAIGGEANASATPSSNDESRHAGSTLETRALRTGPRIIEALLGEAIDVGVCGPAALVGAKARYGDDLLRVLTGCASGGASLVVLPALASRGGWDGRTLATPQIGSTQDVALHKWLSKHGENRVRVTQLAGADIVWAMKRGDVHGAWLPEPWGTRLVEEAGAVRIVDERDEWPDHVFASAVVVVRRAFYEARAAEARVLQKAIEAEVLACQQGTSCEQAYVSLGKVTHNPGPRRLWDLAWKRVDFTSSTLRASIRTFAEDAANLGILPRVDVDTLFLNEPS